MRLCYNEYFTEHKGKQRPSFDTIRRWYAKEAWRKDRYSAGKSRYLTPPQELVFAHFVVQAAAAGAALRVSDIKLRAKALAKVNGRKLPEGSPLDASVTCPGSNHLLPLAPRCERLSRAQPSKGDADPRASMCRGSS